MKNLYTIQWLMESQHPEREFEPVWRVLFPFDCMQKSFAQGAWAMLKSFYNHKYKHRLLKDGEVVEELNYQKVVVN